MRYKWVSHWYSPSTLASRKNGDLEYLCLFLLQIPVLELYMLAGWRREMGSQCLHPGPSLAFGYFISAKMWFFYLFFSESRTLLDKYACLSQGILHKQ